LHAGDVAASSTCEMIFEFIKALDEKVIISKDCADCLYTGIMTDTGSFKYSSTTSKTHQVVANLIDQGARNTYIHGKLFDTNTYERMRLLGFCLSEKLTILNEYHTAFIALTAQELESFNYNNQTVMLAPASGFYSTPGAGEDEVRIAYVLNLDDLKNAMDCLEEALNKYPGSTKSKK
jgi:nanoRNase/pAp phosphatase (c-di-AMP/oligoRNAs hydrolase)